MAVKANEIEQYHGDAALGLNNQGLSQYGDTDLTQTHTANFNLAYLNMQKNKSVWEQKIKDRDASMALIAGGAMEINQALPGDRKRIMEMLDGAEKTWVNNNGDLKSNPEVWIKFNQELAKIREGNIVAQSRLKDYNQGMTEAAKEVDPNKKKKMIDHWNAEIKKDLYEPLLPYQQTLDWDNQKVAPPMQTESTDLGIDPNNKYNRVSKVKTDVEASYRDYLDKYMNGDKEQMALNVDEYLKNFFGQNGLLGRDDVSNRVEQVNARLREIARAEGYKVDDPNVKLPEHLRPVQIYIDKSGQLHSTGRKWDDWFKIQLYDQYKNKTTSAYDENLAKLDKTKAEIDALKALAEQRRAAAGLNKAKAGQANAKTAAIKQTFIPDENYNELEQKQEVWTRNGEGVAVVQWDKLSENTKKYLGVEPLTNNGGKNRWIELKPANVVDAQGKKLTEREVIDLWNKVKGAGKYKTLLEFLKDYTNKAGGSFDIEAQGREKGTEKGKVKDPKTGEEKTVTTPTRKLGRSTRLAAFQNQVKDLKINKNSEVLEEDNTPAPLEEE